MKIEHTIVPWESADQQYMAAFAGGNPPDIAYLPDQYMAGYADKGQLADVGPYTDKAGYADAKAAVVPECLRISASTRACNMASHMPAAPT